MLRYLVDGASGFRVVRGVGVESDMELAFAGLQELCAPLVGRLALLPEAQRHALSVAFGLASGDRPDRFLVGLAVLTLLAETAEEQPLVCVIDDAQWLDQASAQVLGFVGRRLLAEPIALVFAARTPVPSPDPLAGWPECRLGGLDEAAVRELVATVTSGPLDERVRARVIRESRGNPLALLELGRRFGAVELAGGFVLPGPGDLHRRIEDEYVARLSDLPRDAQRLIVLAAADPVGDPALLLRAAQALGLDIGAVQAAADAGLLEIGANVCFRHPLVRSAAYHAASLSDRHDVHAALAEATDPDADPDRRAWHRARSLLGPDEDVAVELERSAGRAQARGGLAAAAAFLERSAELTPDPERRAQRALAAAQAKHQAGAPEAALTLLTMAEAGPFDELHLARVDLLRAQMAFGSSHGRDAPRLLLAAAEQLQPFDPVLARDTYLDALSAALFVGRLADGVGLAEVAKAARASPAGSSRPPDFLLDGLTLVIAEGYAVGAPALERAVSAFRSEQLPPAEAIRWLWLATHAAHDLWDDQGWEVLCTRHVSLARQAGALTVLPMALSARIGLHLFAGELAQAASLVSEVAAVTAATGSRLPPYGALALAALQGRVGEASELISVTSDELAGRGEGMGLTLVQHATAVLYNGLGRYEEALVAAKQGAAYLEELGFSIWSLPELVEAGVRSGQGGPAADALQQLAETTQASGTDWALGIEARSRALLSEDEGAERLYLEAIERLSRTRLPMQVARARLLYGEWLRRQHRRVEARDQLRAAHEMFTAMGVEGFAERARCELVATGETVRRRTVETVLDLTAQEAHIAHLARERLTNPEIGARLFLSPRTVEWHLRKVFTKLGITSRRQLDEALRRREQGDRGVSAGPGSSRPSSPVRR